MAFNYAPPQTTQTFNYAPPTGAPPPPAQKQRTFLGDISAALTRKSEPVTGPFTAPKSIAGDIVLTTINSYANSLKDAGGRLTQATATAKNPNATAVEKASSVVSVGLGGISAFLAPITAAAAGAEKIPVLGGVAHAINNVFGAIGVVGSDALEQSVNMLPFSQKTKDTIMPVAQEFGALAAQIVAGKGGEKVFDAFVKKRAELTTHLSDAVKTEVPKTVTEAPTTFSYEPPKTVTAPVSQSPLLQEALKYKSAEEFVKAQNKDVYRKMIGYVGRNDFPKLSAHPAGTRLPDEITVYRGVPSKGTVQTNNVGEYFSLSKSTAQKYGDKIIELKAPKSDFRVNPYVPGIDLVYYPKGTKPSPVLFDSQIASQLTDLWKKAHETPIAPTPTPETGNKPSGLALNIEKKAMEAGTINEPLKTVAGFQSTTQDIQAKAFEPLAAKGPKEIIDVLKGRKPLPEGMNSGGLIRNAEEYLKTNPNPDIVEALANTVHASEVSGGASSLSMLQGREPVSFTQTMSDIKRALAERVAPKLERVKKVRDSALKKVNLDAAELKSIGETLDAFITKNIC